MQFASNDISQGIYFHGEDSTRPSDLSIMQRIPPIGHRPNSQSRFVHYAREDKNLTGNKIANLPLENLYVEPELPSSRK